MLLGMYPLQSGNGSREGCISLVNVYYLNFRPDIAFILPWLDLMPGMSVKMLTQELSMST